MSLNVDTYNKIAKDWHEDHKNDDWWVAGAEEFSKHIKARGSILDVGCAGGLKTQYFLDKGFDVVGIDNSEEFIKIAKNTVRGGDFKLLPMERVKELNQTFDGILAQASLLHIEKKQAFGVISDLSSVLNKGGYFYISVKSISPGRNDEEVVVEDDYGYKYRRFFSYYSIDELREYFNKINLEIVYENESDGGHSGWLQIIGRK